VSYDGNGNLTGDPGPISGGASATTFTHDSENRLTGASGAHSATLAYDPLDRRGGDRYVPVTAGL
jgi:hypothetical protein